MTGDKARRDPSAIDALFGEMDAATTTTAAVPLDPDLAVSVACASAEHENYADALGMLTVAERKYPDHRGVKAWQAALRGCLAQQAGDEAAALGHYSEALDLDPDHALANARMAVLRPSKKGFFEKLFGGRKA